MASDPSLSPEYLAADQGPHILAVIISVPIVAAVIVGLRLYTRLVVIRSAAKDDLAITLALVFSIASSICQGFQVKYGMGKHVQAVNMEDGIKSLQALFASIIVYAFCLTCIKFSILFQYMRISIDRSIHIVCWVMMAISIATFIEACFISTFTCDPVAKFWDDRISGHCISREVIWYTNAGINISTDVVLMILPIFLIRQLQLRTREKYTLAAILGLGGFASIASILRLRTLHVLAHSQDPTWDSPPASTWSCIELNLGIICASLPPLRAFVMKHFPRVFRSTRQASQKTRTKAQTNHETDESELVSMPARKPSVDTNTSIPLDEAEKGDSKSFASDTKPVLVSSEFERLN